MRVPQDTVSSLVFCNGFGPIRGQGVTKLSTPEDLSKLIMRVARRDRAAFDALYAATAAKLFGVLLRILEDRAEAEDALQEVFVRIWRKAGRFEGADARPMPWLIAVARNHGIDIRRARRSLGSGPEEGEEAADTAPTPETATLAEGTRLAACFAALGTDAAKTVSMAYLDGCTVQGLADRTGLPPDDIRTRLRESLQDLKSCLDNDGRDQDA